MSERTPTLRIAHSSEASAPAAEASASQTTDALARRAQDGDSSAWARLYQDTFDGVYRRLLYLTGNPSTAEELTQETYVRAFLKLDTYSGTASFAGWLSTVALNLTRNYWRKQQSSSRTRRRFAVLSSVRPQNEARGPADAVLLSQRTQALYRALDQLPGTLREAFVLRELEGLPRDEAAAMIGITRGNLSVRVNRAKAQLTSLLIDMGYVEGGTR